MPNYGYEGIDRSGRNVAGKMAAVDETELEEKLRALGLWLVRAKTDKTDGRAKRRRRWAVLASRPPRREIVNFCTLMSFQLKVGIPMVTALQVTAEDCEHAQFRATLVELKQQIEAGMLLCEAMDRFSTTFPPQFVSLVRAGESSSTLPDTFLELKRYMEWQEQIMADVHQATIYPAAVSVVVMALVMVLFTFVVPRFVKLLAAVNVQLPMPTRIVFRVSDLVKGTWWIWLIGILVVPPAVALARRRYKKFAIFYDKVKFRLPLFGSLNRMLTMARLARNLGILYSAGVVLVNALKLCRGLVGSMWVATLLEEVTSRVEAGDTLSEALRRHPIFPGLLVRMVAMGEKTGRLDDSLDNVAGYYGAIVPRKIKKIFAIMEPTLILFLVGIVGFVALAIFLPILSLLGSIK